MRLNHMHAKPIKVQLLHLRKSIFLWSLKFFERIFLAVFECQGPPERFERCQVKIVNFW